MPLVSSKQAQGLIRDFPVAQFELGNLKNFVYLILDWPLKRAAIIDPQQDIETPLQALESEGFTLDSILLTHTHHDHIAGLPALLTRYPQIPVFLNERDRFRLQGKIEDLHPHYYFVMDGQEIRVGDLHLKTHYTPGHSQGACSYFLDLHVSGEGPFIFSGDTLFVRECGRTDLETGSDPEMFASLQKFKQFPDETVLCCGHHYASECATLLGEEKLRNPALRCRSVEELAALP